MYKACASLLKLRNVINGVASWLAGVVRIKVVGVACESPTEQGRCDRGGRDKG